MKDKLLRGLIAGAIAGIVKDIPPLIFHIAKHEFFPTYWDYADRVSFGVIPQTLGEIAYAIFLEVLFSICVGVIFVHILPKLKSGLWYLKGAGLGFGIWFFIRMGVSLFKLHEFIHPQIFVSMINVSTSMGYGVLLAYIDRTLENKKSLAKQ